MSSSEGLSVRDVDVDLEGRPTVRDATFQVPAHRLVALLGPNGSGKTTLLRALAGLEPTRRGTVTLDGRPLDGVPTHRRGIGFLFQEPVLFPGRTVEENVAYGLDVGGWPRGEADARVRSLLARLGLEPLRARRSEELSGGERQRVALARTLAPRPRLVLLDEPLAAVDPAFRAGLREAFRATLAAEGTAALYVTHDPDEALAVGDGIILLREGRIVQLGTPEEVLRRPVDLDAARFLGYQVLPTADGWTAAQPRELEAEAPGPGSWAGIVESVRPGLGEQVVRVRRADGWVFEWRPGDPQVLPAPGAEVALRPRRPVRYAAERPGGPG